jgi:hypothetical protein
LIFLFAWVVWDSLGSHQDTTLVVRGEEGLLSDGAYMLGTKVRCFSALFVVSL